MRDQTTIDEAVAAEPAPAVSGAKPQRAGMAASTEVPACPADAPAAPPVPPVPLVPPDPAAPAAPPALVSLPTWYRPEHQAVMTAAPRITKTKPCIFIDTLPSVERHPLHRLS